jgi:hypothetical protein
VDDEHDPVAGLARAAQTMAETQHLALRTIRGLAWLQGFACVMIGLALLGMGYLIWLGLAQSHDHAALTRALLALVTKKMAEALAMPNKDIADIRTDIAVIKATLVQLTHRLNLLMIVVVIVLVLMTMVVIVLTHDSIEYQ